MVYNLCMPKVFTSEKQKIGKLGEDLANMFLVKHGYVILEENYTKKYGEIDLIAKKDGIIHFIEVKSVVSHETLKKEDKIQSLDVSHETNSNSKSNENKTTKNIQNSTVTRETYKNPKYDPLSNVHPQKLRRLSRVIQVYLVSHETKQARLTKNTYIVTRETSNLGNFDTINKQNSRLHVSHETKWQFDVITVKIDQESRIGRVEHIKDIII